MTRHRSRPRRSAPASKAACDASAPITSTSTTCTSPIARRRSRTPSGRWTSTSAPAGSGTSACPNYAAWQIAELRCTAARGGLVSPVVSQPIYNLLARRIEEEYAELASRAGLLNIVYNPLGGGLLTGKHRFEEPATGTGRFASNPLGERYRERYWDRRLFDAVEALRSASEAAGVTLIDTAFRWLLSRELVDAVLIGASTVEHLKANVKAAEGPPLPDELVRACDDVWDELRGPAPAYNR